MSQPASPWDLHFIKGEPITLESGRGNTVFVLEFWATWCPPCRTSIPHITELQNKFQSRNVVFIGVTNEDESKAKPFVNRMGAQMNYRVAIDANGSVSNNYMGRYGEQGIPCAFVIDKAGKVVYHGHPMEPRFEQALEEAVNAPSSATATANTNKSFTREELANLKVHDLREIVASRHISSAGLLEKQELVDAILRAQLA
jgi:peroxiredoxin